jgi:nucleotide sugar dehydrogenase
MGKIGLPLAVCFAKKGNKVTGLDINLNTIEKINSGNEPFPGEENLGLYLKEVIDNNFLKATFDIESAIKSADVILVCVPLIIDSNSKADFSGIDLVVENIGKYMRKGVLISIETTLPVGTTRNRFAKSIQTVSSLRVGQEFSMVFSPERVSSGRIFNDLRSYPKLVGGVTESCTQKGIDFYEAVLDFDKRSDLPKPNGVWALQNCETAEFTKIAETTYRDVNIGLANEFALYAASKVIDFI